MIRTILAIAALSLVATPALADFRLHSKNRDKPWFSEAYEAPSDRAAEHLGRNARIQFHGLVDKSVGHDARTVRHLPPEGAGPTPSSITTQVYGPRAEPSAGLFGVPPVLWTPR